MLNIFGIRLSLKLLLIVFLISLAAEIARADDKSKEIAPVSSSATDAKQAPAADSEATVAPKPPSISYALFSQATMPQPEVATPLTRHSFRPYYA